MQRVLGVAVALLMIAMPVAAQQPADTTDVPCATNAAVSVVDESRQRFFCEAMDSTFFIQFQQFQQGLAYLEENYPDFVEVKVIGETVGGLPVYFVEVTNEQSVKPRDEKLQIGYSASIHANEAAGREGMARVIEDLAAGIGPFGAQLQPLLNDIIVNVWFPNADSWAAGDYWCSSCIAGLHSPADGVGFQRANAAGVDLNREFPNPGLIHKDHTPMSEPESQAVVKELRFSGNHSSLVAGTDLHGMLSSENMMRMIIPNQDYDFRRMVLSVDQLLTIEEGVDNDPAFREWKEAGGMIGMLADQGITQPGIPVVGGGALPAKPLQWGARWDMIGYTDTGFTSDYLMLSPRSPTGGMGAVGTITEFAYSHMVPDNRYVNKLTDMHVAGVRHIVKAQMEMAGRLDTPVLAGTGPVAFLDDGSYVSSADDEGRYEVGRQFDRDDESTWFDFDQVEYNVTNLRFWRDLDRFSDDPIEALSTKDFTAAQLADYQHLVITDQVLDALTDAQVTAIASWVDTGGHVLLTDAALQFFERAGLGGKAAKIGTYLGYSDVVDKQHALMDGVTWEARVTGEGPAIGINVGGPYPQWTLSQAPAGTQIVGTTQGAPSLGRVSVGSGSIDFLGGALPMPVQVSGPNADHRYGLADYSVSAFTYWIVMNSLGGHIEWLPIDTPFVPYYDFDPLNQAAVPAEPTPAAGEKGSPGLPLVALLGVVALAFIARRR